MLIDKKMLLEALEKEFQAEDSIQVGLGLMKAISIIEKFKTFDEPEPKALTLDELRERNKSPVYCKGIINAGLTGWGIVNAIAECVYDGTGDWREFDEYGETWLAYDREVKGDKNDG